MIWKIVAWFLSRPRVANWLIERAKKTPYTHLIAKDGKPYMNRYWVFNPYTWGRQDKEASKYPWFPWNIRIHWIRRADQDDHMHDHPWNARTIILRGGYVEKRLIDAEHWPHFFKERPLEQKVFTRIAGTSAKIGYGMYHKITHIQVGGAWTLFISGPYQGTWGFLVDGVKVQWRKYLGLEK